MGEITPLRSKRYAIRVRRSLGSLLKVLAEGARAGQRHDLDVVVVRGRFGLREGALGNYMMVTIVLTIALGLLGLHQFGTFAEAR